MTPPGLAACDRIQARGGDPGLVLLLLCARPRLFAPTPVALAEAAAQVPDWERFFSLARHHGLVPLVAESHDGSPFLPQAVYARMAQAIRGNAIRSLRYCAALVRMVGDLEQAGIPTVALKGPVLSIVLYGAAELRSFSDLDVLVRPRDLHIALERLRALGYRALLAGEAGDTAYPLRGRQDIVLQHPATEVIVELHWRLARANVDLRLCADEVVARAERVPVLDHEVLSLAPVDQFLFLATHAANHGWAQLEQLRSLGELVTQHPHVDWADCLREAERRGVARRTRMAVLLLDSLGVPWDPQIVRRASADSDAFRLSGQARASWGEMQTRREGEIAPAWLLLRSLDTHRARARYAGALAFEPHELDWAAVPLPRPLHPLYYLVHPARLASRYLRRLLDADS